MAKHYSKIVKKSEQWASHGKHGSKLARTTFGIEYDRRKKQSRELREKFNSIIEEVVANRRKKNP